MQNAITSPDQGEDCNSSVKNTTLHKPWRAQPSQYEHWLHIPSLEQEARRLISLPLIEPQESNPVMQWRRKQVWLIEQRIKAIKKHKGTTKNV